jgi:hypothetical protein
VIPLISKRLNNVEKYISDFTPKTGESRAIQTRKNTIENRRGESSDRVEVQHYRSAQLNPFIEEEELRQLNERCCVKYSSITAQKSEERIETLSRL